MDSSIVCPECTQNDLLIALDFLGDKGANKIISFRKGSLPAYEDIPKWLRRLAQDIFRNDLSHSHMARVRSYLRVPEPPRLKKPVGFYELSVGIAVISLLLGILFEEVARASFFAVFVLAMAAALVALVF